MFLCDNLQDSCQFFVSNMIFGNFYSGFVIFIPGLFVDVVYFLKS
jgi:hypothetical protein